MTGATLRPSGAAPARRGAGIEVRGLTWQPDGADLPVLQSLDLAVAPGERVLLVGPSGAGKSTLLRALAGVLATNEGGRLEGSIRLDGAEVAAGDAGLLMQSPEDAAVAESAARDTAFGLENLGVPMAAMPPRIGAVHAAVRFPYGPGRLVAALSGGELQRLALAGVLALHPRLVLLDEPTAMLDPDTAAAVHAAIRAAVHEAGATVVAAEHHFESWDDADRVVVLGPGGRLLRAGPPGEVLRELERGPLAGELWLPRLPPPVPIPIAPRWCAPARPVRADVLVRVERLTYEHRGDGIHGAADAGRGPVLEDVQTEVRPGRILAITGRSGAGKSTLTALIAGVLAPTTGRVHAGEGLRGEDLPPELAGWPSRALAARVGWVPQQAEIAVVDRTVRADVLRTARELGLDEPGSAERADALLEVLGLAPLADLDPHLLSGGQLRRLALASAVAHGPALLVLDEPTVGQDRATWAAVAGVMIAARDAGAAVVVATHDPLLIALADDRLHLERRPQPPVSEEGGARGRRPLAARCGPLSLLAAGILLLAGSAAVTSVAAGLAGLLGEAALAPFVLGRTGVRRGRLVPGLLAVTSIGLSTWLLGVTHDPAAGLTAALRIAFFVLPGVGLAGWIDASSLGDHLAQRLHLPPRPVVVAVAAWQRLDQLGRLWQQLRAVRRIRGLSGARAGRLRELAAVTFGLLIASVRQAGRLAVAMEARGFSSQRAMHGRTWAMPAPWLPSDSVLVGLAAAVALVPVAVTIALRALA